MSKQPVQPRRPRTLAGTTPPDITRTFSALIACAEVLRSALLCCDNLTTARVGRALSTAYHAAADTDLRQITLSALRAVAFDHSCPGVFDASVVAACMDTLEDTWDSTAVTVNLNDSIAAAVAAGYDGELLCWDIISIESNNHIGLIRKEASKLLRKLPERSTDELIGYGWTGLRFALRQYNPDLGFSFSTYACPRINGAIRDGVRSESPLPKRLTTVVRAAVAVEEKLTHELQRTPSYSEIAAELDTIKAASLLPRLQPSASIEELSTAWDSDKYRDPGFLIDDADPAEETHRLLQIEAVRDAIAGLPEDEATAIRMLCLQERTLTDAAAELGVEARVLRAAKRRGMTALASSLGSLRASV